MSLNRRDCAEGGRSTRRQRRTARLDLRVVGGAAVQARARRQTALLALEQVPRCGEQGDDRGDQRVHPGHRRRSSRRERVAGRHPDQGRGRGQRRQRTRHRLDAERHRAPVSRQAARRHRCGRLYRQQIRRLVPDRTKPTARAAERWIAIPSILVGVLPTYRISWVKQAGFDKFPADSDGFLKLCQQLHKVGHPAGFAFGHATNDATCWCHWLLWSHGGRIVDEQGRVAINSPADAARARIRARNLSHADSRHAVVERRQQQQGISRRRDRADRQLDFDLRQSARRQDADRGRYRSCDLADRARSASPTELHLIFPLITFKYTKYPNAAKAFLTFMMEKEQYQTLLRSSVGYISQSLKAYENDPSWFTDREDHAVSRGERTRAFGRHTQASSDRPQRRRWRISSWSICSPKR